MEVSSAPDSGLAPERVKPFPVLVASAWCGLVSGLLEVATVVVRKHTFDPNHLYEMTRHFVWLIPLTNICLFMAVGVVLKVLMLLRPRPFAWVAPRLLCAMTLLPLLLVGLPRIHGLAWFAVTLGAATRIIPYLERHAAQCRRIAILSAPLAGGLLMILAASEIGRNWLSERRQNTIPMAAKGSPNVLLVVLDTVAAEHLSLYGYQRSTTPALLELAERGIRFDRVQAASSWTLPSHASMFTGRWPHDLSAGWLTPLDATFPTLAEFLRSRGYATAGFIANYSYCASGSGLERGFSTYEDYTFAGLSPSNSAALVDRPLKGILAAEQFLEYQLDIDFLRSPVQRLTQPFNAHRKDAAAVSREFLDWFRTRQQPERPFFAFLNYYDAHSPYELPLGRVHRFGAKPTDPREIDMIGDWWSIDKARVTPRDIDFAVNAYDDCVANLDEELGRLFDELGRKGALEKTWLIITADHGESFGEHSGVFCHGTSLYQTELHVPLLIIPPGGITPKRVVTETVSLRNIAATIVDLLDVAKDSPFPGESLARFWNGSARSPTGEAALSEVVPIDPTNPDPLQMLKPHWPLAAVNAAGWTYIRREGEVHEQLFHLKQDPNESQNLAPIPAAQTDLDRMRKSLNTLTSGPLTPQRFKP